MDKPLIDIYRRVDYQSHHTPESRPAGTYSMTHGNYTYINDSEETLLELWSKYQPLVSLFFLRGRQPGLGLKGRQFVYFFKLKGKFSSLRSHESMMVYIVLIIVINALYNVY